MLKQISTIAALIAFATPGQTILAQTIIPFESSPPQSQGEPLPAQGYAPIPIQVIPAPTPPPSATPSCSAVIDSTLNQIVGNANFRGASVGVEVASLKTNAILYSYQANNSFIPASNVKLFTTAAILRYKSPWEKFRNTSWLSWVNNTNLTSNNGIAQMLFNHLGGEANIKTALSSIGVNPNEYRQVDGSGLSRSNQSTPNAIVSLLTGMQSEPQADHFFSSLPVAGQTGTLTRRLKSYDTQGRVRAKTGTLNGVRALSGYADNPEHGLVAFSILANQPTSRGHGSNLVSGIDQLVSAIATLPSCKN